MKGAELKEYLNGKWLLSRKITDPVSPFNLIEGEALFIHLKKNILSYTETLEVKWKDGRLSNAYKKYDYVLAKKNELGLYDNTHNKLTFMFKLVNGKNHNTFEGSYECIADKYHATYTIIDNNQFEILFNVTGPHKNYSIITHFIRDTEFSLTGIAETENSDICL